MEDNKEIENKMKERIVIVTEIKENKLRTFLQVLFVILFIVGSFLFCSKGFTVTGLTGVMVVILSVIGSVKVN